MECTNQTAGMKTDSNPGQCYMQSGLNTTLPSSRHLVVMIVHTVMRFMCTLKASCGTNIVSVMDGVGKAVPKVWEGLEDIPKSDPPQLRFDTYYEVLGSLRSKLSEISMGLMDLKRVETSDRLLAAEFIRQMHRFFFALVQDLMAKSPIDAAQYNGRPYDSTYQLALHIEPIIVALYTYTEAALGDETLVSVPAIIGFHLRAQGSTKSIRDLKESIEFNQKKYRNASIEKQLAVFKITDSTNEILCYDASEMTFNWLLQWLEDDEYVQLKKRTLVEFTRSSAPNAPFFIDANGTKRRAMCDVIATAFTVWMEEADGQDDEDYGSDDDLPFEETAPRAPSQKTAKDLCRYNH